MKLDEFVAVSKLPGLYRMVANRSNGLIVEDLDSGKRRFASARQHDFTPLASIGIYTEDDTSELSQVFTNMLEQFDTNPPVSPNVSAEEISTYFGTILPEFDRDRVHTRDIKKVIKWFTFLKERDLLKPAEEEAAEEKVTADEEE